ncbi:hypothetical protein [Gemmatimonas sp.]|uniref:hypothetical protein n=1 Tax=Gemmatimonas sp. TaxID=1962908 RepID=UPI003F70EAAF
MTPVYEAQADILAGYYFSLLLPRPDPAALDTEEALNAQRIAFDLGVEQYAVAAHPPHEARLTAARLGMMAGLAERFSSDPNRRVSMRSLNAKLQRPPGMPLLDWTLKAAKLVARHNKSAVSSLVADEQATIKWNTSGSNPIVDYKTSYQNTGDRTIDVTLQVNVHIVPRSNPSATSEWKVSRLWHTATVKEWTFRLKPNARHTVSGRLRWVPLDPEETKRMDIALTMPAIRIPPDVMSLISADFADEHDSSRQSDTKDGVLDALAVAESINPLSDAADSAAFFTLGVRSIVSDAINKFTNIRAGMGKRSGDDIVFPSSILPLGALEATVWKVATDDENYVSVDLYDGPSRQAAEQKMAQVTSWLETAFSTAPASFSTTSTLHSANFHSDDAHVNLRVVLRTTRAGGYDVALYVEPSDE